MLNIDGLALARRIGAYCAANGITKETLSEETGISSANLSQWRKGGNPSRSKVHSLEGFVGMPIEAFMSDSAYSQTENGLESAKNPTADTFAGGKTWRAAMSAEERRLLAEIQDGGGERYVPGGAHPGGAYASLQNKGFLRAEYHNRRDDLEGGFAFDGITFRVTPEGADALKNGGYVAQMSELLEQLTPTQAEFLLAVMRQMLKPIRDYVK